ncbi:MAG: NAD-glutamate dehydrogenase, partial [Rhodospirillales bacterium]|nr:NAD-glutamate dehydrogenase [Rhodospirillales bacterium]
PRVEEHGWKSPHTIVEIVNDDMPFLVDSVTMELAHQGHAVHQIIHPVANVLRGPEGDMVGLGGAECEPKARPGDGAQPGAEADDASATVVLESLMHLEIDEQSDPDVLATIKGQIERVLIDVRVAVQDWRAMLDQLDTTIQTLVGSPPPVDPAVLDEAVEFLAWLGDNHFTVLWYREYDFHPEAASDPLTRVVNSGLGILRDPKRHVLQSRRR